MKNVILKIEMTLTTAIIAAAHLLFTCMKIKYSVENSLYLCIFVCVNVHLCVYGCVCICM